MSHLRLAYSKRLAASSRTGGQPAPSPADARPKANAVTHAKRHGVAILAGSSAAVTRAYVCDDESHCIRVFDGAGEPIGAFGGAGTTPGRFVGPTDIVVVRPRFVGEPAEADLIEPYLAVADRFNSRVQILTADGVFIGSIGTRAAGTHGERNDSGWPYFRLAEHPLLREPVRLAWRSPWLDVTCATGEVVRIDLAQALLPLFAEWHASAGATERARAARHFRLARLRRGALPPAVLATLAAGDGEAVA